MNDSWESEALVVLDRRKSVKRMAVYAVKNWVGGVATRPRYACSTLTLVELSS
jgi:hypothetical protein